MKKIALITGATAGIGKAAAMKFAENDYRIIITGRRAARLDELAKNLNNDYGVEALPLNFDVRNLEEVKSAVNSIPSAWQTINVLLNNAGLAAGFGPIDEGNTEHWEQMIDTNVKGLLYVTKMIIPFLKKTQGHIINIGSIAGKETYINGNVYCATKHAVDALTKAMRIDLLQHHIRVTGICPGATETEFSLVRHDWDEEKAKKVYKGFKPLCAEDVAEAIWFAASQPAHVNINDLVIVPSAQANTVHLKKEEE